MSTVPYTFATASGNVPASQLDANFANVKASVDSAVVVTAEAQPNIRSVGTLSSLTVTGNVTAANFIGTIVGNVSNAVFATTAATVTTAAQPNITALGTLTSLVSSGNITSGGNISGSYILGNGSQLTGVTANYNNSNVTTLLSSFGSNTISTTGNITAGYFIGNGSQLTGITANYSDSNVTTLLSSFGSNTISTTGNITAQNFIGTVVGNISNAVFATTAATVTTAAQPNITSVGTLTSLTVTGNVTGGNLLTGGLISATGNIDTNGKRITLSATAANSTDGNTSGIYLGANIASFIYNSSLDRWDAGNQGLATFANVNAGNLRTTGLISATGNITADNFIGGGAGTPTLSSATNLDLSAVVAVRVVGGGTFRLPNLTTAQISNVTASNGDMVYNTTENKMQVYVNGAWGNVTVS